MNSLEIDSSVLRQILLANPSMMKHVLGEIAYIYEDGIPGLEEQKRHKPILGVLDEHPRLGIERLLEVLGKSISSGAIILPRALRRMADDIETRQFAFVRSQPSLSIEKAKHLQGDLQALVLRAHAAAADEFQWGLDEAIKSPKWPRNWMDGATPVKPEGRVRFIYGGAPDAIARGLQLSELVGIALSAEGCWRRVDQSGDTINCQPSDFDLHPIWGGIRDVMADDGLAMVEIPRFWMRSEMRGDERMWWVSPRAREGFGPHPAFLAPDGRSCATLRVAKYLASDQEGGIALAAGSTPWTSITIDEARRKCTALGEGWRMWSVYDQAAIQLLALIEMGTPDMQDAIARGNVDGDGVKTTGSSGAAWRGIHDLWGNVWQFIDGLRISAGGVIEVWHDMLPGPDAWVNTGVAYGPGKEDGFPTDLHREAGRGFNLSCLFLPSEVSDEREDAIIPDYVWGRWSDRETIAIGGGDWSYGADAGVFALYLYVARSNSSAHIGFRPAFVI